MNDQVNNYAQVEQGSPEWHALRNGKFTASKFSCLVADVKRDMSPEELKAWKEKNPNSRATTCVDATLLATGAQTYVEAVASERLTGMPADDEFNNYDMQWGKDHEPKAKALYKAAFGVDGQDVGFVGYLDYAGASPDWVVPGIFGCEIKCPRSRAKHMKYATLVNSLDLKEKHPDHYWQCVGGMLATGLKMWKFISYHPHYPPVKQLKIVNVPWVEVDGELLKTKLEAAEKACQYLSSMKFL